MLSQTAEYALRAVLFLADRPNGQPVRVEEIGGVLGMPSAYLSKILNTLVRARILTSLRGRHGGVRVDLLAEYVIQDNRFGNAVVGGLGITVPVER